jgi:hypothetical protein
MNNINNLFFRTAPTIGTVSGSVGAISVPIYAKKSGFYTDKEKRPEAILEIIVLSTMVGTGCCLMGLIWPIAIPSIAGATYATSDT